MIVAGLQADVQHRKEDFAFVLGGIMGILEEHMAVQNGYLPGSKRPVPYILETCMSTRLHVLSFRFLTSQSCCCGESSILTR
jgi:hypothetical protein